jgi:hypothetical protein
MVDMGTPASTKSFDDHSTALMPAGWQHQSVRQSVLCTSAEIPVILPSQEVPFLLDETCCKYLNLQYRSLQRIYGYFS